MLKSMGYNVENIDLSERTDRSSRRQFALVHYAAVHAPPDADHEGSKLIRVESNGVIEKMNRKLYESNNMSPIKKSFGIPVYVSNLLTQDRNIIPRIIPCFELNIYDIE